MTEAIAHINCPKCSQKKSVLSAESILHICLSCHAIFGNTDKENNRKFNKDLSDRAETLQLGLQLKHNELLYTVTGKLVKYEENDDQAVWVEYVLTHPEAENIYLACWSGHWSLLEFIPDFETKWKPSDMQKDLECEGISYTYFHKYRTRIAYAEGEFNFNVFADDKKAAFEYINPPLTIILEYDKDTKQLNAFKSAYLYRGELKRKFTDKISLDSSSGIAGNQPYYWNINPPLFLQGSFFMFFLMLLMQLLIQYFYPAVLVTRDEYGMLSSDSTKVYAFDSFSVPYDNALMNVTMGSSSLSNDWIATEMTLVNDATAEERSFSMETERYSGYTDGESWSEGAYLTNGNINSVKKGTYHFEISPIQQSGSATKDVYVKAEVFKGSWSVFWCFAGMLIISNIVLGISHDYFEHKKWGEDYDTFDFLYQE